MPSDTTPTVGLLLIGTELLTGKIRDANGRHCIEGLAEVGARLGEIRVVHDDVPGIAAAIRDMNARFDWLVTSGGIGPTHDDVTMRAVATAFDVDLVRNDELQEHIDRVFGDSAENLRVWSRMALVPSGCTLLSEPDMFWPVYRMDTVFVLPGVPQIFQRQFDAIRPVFAGQPRTLGVLYVTEGEGAVAEPLSEANEAFPTVQFGSYPVWGNPDFRTRLTVEGTDPEQVRAAVEWLAARLGPIVRDVSFGERTLRD